MVPGPAGQRPASAGETAEGPVVDGEVDVLVEDAGWWLRSGAAAALVFPAAAARTGVIAPDLDCHAGAGGRGAAGAFHLLVRRCRFLITALVYAARRA
jgi:hypothetical protein